MVVAAGRIPVIRREADDPDPAMPPKWKVWTNTIRDSSGVLVVPVSGILTGRRHSASGHWTDLIRFPNIDDGPEPEDLEMTWLPEEPITPLPRHGIEPSIVLLPDGRLFMGLRTGEGSVWYTVSEDAEGRSWRRPEPMLGRRRARSQSREPVPCFHLADGRYLLQYHNNDGSASGGPQPMWSRPYSFSRRSMFIAVGEYGRMRTSPYVQPGQEDRGHTECGRGDRPARLRHLRQPSPTWTGAGYLVPRPQALPAGIKEIPDSLLADCMCHRG